MSDLVDVSVPVPSPAIEPASDPVPETTTESKEQSAELAMVSDEVAGCWNLAEADMTMTINHLLPIDSFLLHKVRTHVQVQGEDDLRRLLWCRVKGAGKGEEGW